MIKDFIDAHRETETEYRVEFFTDRDGGCSFPCDKEGNPQFDKMTDAAKENYKKCMQNPDKFPYCWNEVHKLTWSYTEPASGTCKCGTRIELYNQYHGACECPECGQWYNLFGQELVPPEYWMEDIEPDV